MQRVLWSLSPGDHELSQSWFGMTGLALAGRAGACIADSARTVRDNERGRESVRLTPACSVGIRPGRTSIEGR